MLPLRTHVLCALVALVLVPLAASGQPLTVGGYTLVRERAISKTVSEYEYRAVLTNGGASNLARVSGAVVALLPTTNVLDGNLTFDNVPAGGTRLSSDELASNVAMARSAAGIHWRSDNAAGLLLGEAIAIDFLGEMRGGLPERFAGLSLTLFDGRGMTV